MDYKDRQRFRPKIICEHRGRGIFKIEDKFHWFTHPGLEPQPTIEQTMTQIDNWMREVAGDPDENEIDFKLSQLLQRVRELEKKVEQIMPTIS